MFSVPADVRKRIDNRRVVWVDSGLTELVPLAMSRLSVNSPGSICERKAMICKMSLAKSVS